MQIDGQDHFAALKREEGRSRISPEPGRQNLLVTVPGSETSGFPQPRLPDLEILPAISRHEGWAQRDPESERQRPWSPGIERRHEIERTRYPTDYPMGWREKPTGLAEGFRKVCERWSLDALGMARLMHLEEEIGLSGLVLSGQVPPLTGDLKDRMALVIGISIGLGELLDDDKDAELQWLRSARPEFGNLSPLEHLLKGDLLNLRDVVDLLDRARGLR